MLKPELLHDVPDTLTTERLVLRVPRAGEGGMIADAVQASLPELMRWMPWARADYTAEDGEIFARLSAAAFIERRELNYRVFTHAGMFVGQVGVHCIVWHIPRFEIGYWARTDQTGNGYITEAVSALTDMLFTQLHAARIEIRCDSRNTKSAAVAERCAYTRDAVLRNNNRDQDGRLFDTLVFSRIAALSAS